MNSNEKLSIFYDGACHLCYREVQHYKRKDKENLLTLVDIAGSNFKASNYGLTSESVNLHMHAINNEGQIFKGINSFVEIWKRLPSYQWLIPIFENKLMRPTLDKMYDLFARHIRPKLPKRSCEDDSCSIR